MSSVHRLGRNAGGYRGETIAIEEVLAALLNAAQGHGWQVECFFESAGRRLWGLHRPAGRAARAGKLPLRLYLSAGIHGDEPAGPVALLRLLEENRWPPGGAFWICPCLNPSGFALNQREDQRGRDLNRDYLRPQSAAIKAHIDWLNRQPSFDLTICLHEDWEADGFYLYELNPEQRASPAAAVIAAVAPGCPIELAPLIEGRAAAGGIVRPALAPAGRPQWPEAFYLLQHKTRHSFTLEAPSDFPMPVRINALMRAVAALLPRD